MIRLVSSTEMAAIDRTAQEQYRIPGISLMECAALLSWQVIRRRTDGPVTFVVGKGNNGGDALAVARHCRTAGTVCRVVCVVPEAKLSDLARTQFEGVRGLDIPVTVWTEDESTARSWISGAPVIVDGMLGTGLSGVAREPLSSVITAVNDRDGVTIALDVPSGGGDAWRTDWPVIRADLTLTLGLPKRFLFSPNLRPHCGEIVHLPLTYPSEIMREADGASYLISLGDLSERLSPLPSQSYKRSRGSVAVLGGSVGMTGAPVLAARSALSCGAGLATVICDAECYPVIASHLVSALARPLGEIDREDLGRHNAVCIGPGWGTENREDLLRGIISQCSRGVLDADALNVLAAMDRPPALDGEWVLTPHVGELARLLGSSTEDVLSQWETSAISAAARYGAVVVAKSHVTVVATPDGTTYVYDGMNPVLATGGSGDVLAGVVAALLCRVTPVDAAIGAVLLHGAAGESAKERGIVLAEELPAFIASRAAEQFGASGGLPA
jgi:hydroxyethylthiazole kinase-like uncharacterized protein yjeF